MNTLDTNRLLEFYQIYKVGAVEDKDELISFEVKGQGHNEAVSEF